MVDEGVFAALAIGWLAGSVASWLSFHLALEHFRMLLLDSSLTGPFDWWLMTREANEAEDAKE